VTSKTEICIEVLVFGTCIDGVEDMRSLFAFEILFYIDDPVGEDD
jgi:hypothetical protein